MTIYIVLIFLILLGYIKSYQNNQKYLFFVFSVIFLICALRAPSVGRDIKGYIQVYEQTQSVEWNNNSYVYFENGYIFLMKICCFFHLSSQMYLAFVSLIILFPIYIIIKKYSKDYVLSTLIYTCYQFFEFNLTGIRQSISMSLCLLGYIVLEQKKKYYIYEYLGIVCIATLVHKGAFIALFALLFVPLRRKPLLSISVPFLLSIVVLFSRQALLPYIKDSFEKSQMNENAQIYIGGNFLFLLGVTFIFLLFEIKRNERCSEYTGQFPLFILIFTLFFPFTILFGLETAARSSMYVSILLIILLPNYLHNLEYKSRVFANTICILFFTAFFFSNALFPNNFDIVPYRFFWITI